MNLTRRGFLRALAAVSLWGLAPKAVPKVEESPPTFHGVTLEYTEGLDRPASSLDSFTAFLKETGYAKMCSPEELIRSMTAETYTLSQLINGEDLPCPQ